MIYILLLHMKYSSMNDSYGYSYIFLIQIAFLLNYMTI